jgi:hypothetical protein
VAVALDTLTLTQRGKLRSLFSMGCFGATHLDKWLSAGFQVASGSVGIYADAALSTPAFLAAWVAGLGFGQAIQAANASDILDFQDRLAREWFRAQGRASSAERVESHRETRGDITLTINGAH